MFTLPPDPYEALGVAKDAQITDIKKSHRKLVLKFHPDKVADESLKAVAQDKFQKVQRAYELLSDDKERSKYDDMVKLNELEKENRETRAKQSAAYDRTSRTESYSRTHSRTAEPYWGHSESKFSRSSTFPSADPPSSRTRTAYDDHIYTSSGESFREPRASRKKEEGKDARGSKSEEDARRRRRAEDEARKEKDKEKERERKERRREEKLKRAEKDAKRDSEGKRGQPREIFDDHQPGTGSHEDSDPFISEADKKARRSGRGKREPELSTATKMASALDHIQRMSTAKTEAPPPLNRAQTYNGAHYTRVASPPPEVPVPPPRGAEYVNTPLPYDEVEEGHPVRRSSARPVPGPRERVSSHKISEEAPKPGLKKKHTMPTDSYAVPPPMSKHGFKTQTEMPFRHMPRSQSRAPEERSSRPRHVARGYSGAESNAEGRFRRQSSPGAPTSMGANHHRANDGKAIRVPAKEPRRRLSPVGVSNEKYPSYPNIGGQFDSPSPRRPLMRHYETHSGATHHLPKMATYSRGY